MAVDRRSKLLPPLLAGSNERQAFALLARAYFATTSDTNGVESPAESESSLGDGAAILDLDNRRG